MSRPIREAGPEGPASKQSAPQPTAPNRSSTIRRLSKVDRALMRLQRAQEILSYAVEDLAGAVEEEVDRG